MKKTLSATAILVLAAFIPSLSSAGDADTCKGCHNGSLAPSFETLKEKFKTADALVAGAKSTQNPMMKAIQADEAKLKAAAAAIVK
ncbi:MAG: hypothetical protein CTY34_09500 [Methylobacter sp.]|nr:MAG: hypothetical protein CTY34_09500 [Methylobacter sp.]PPD03172.1 MAG: hypothetical protein CTY29_10415 [Methylobacter sp.]PPD18725.1 MAG: hypothetical protein CTY24_12500 [Methylobacter sp.]PPD35977.1 MAG: hypothetical protein CTY18_05735 [Methylomonas sp.]